MPSRKDNDQEPIELDPLYDPWERQPQESDASWAKFPQYRDMELPRSLRRLAQHLDVSVTGIGELSKKYRWPERASAWDREQDRAKREQDLQATLDMTKRHATMAQAFANAALEPARKFLEVIAKAREENEDPFGDYDIRELQRAAVEGARAFVGVATFERLSRGLSTANMEGDAQSEDAARQAVAGKTRAEMEAYLTEQGVELVDALERATGGSE